VIFAETAASLRPSPKLIQCVLEFVRAYARRAELSDDDAGGDVRKRGGVGQRCTSRGGKSELVMVNSSMVSASW